MNQQPLNILGSPNDSNLPTINLLPSSDSNHPSNNSTTTTATNTHHQSLALHHHQTPAPPEIESIISNMLNHKNVRGLMILNRQGHLIKSSGPLFTTTATNTSHLNNSTSKSTTTTTTNTNTNLETNTTLRRYSHQVYKIIQSIDESISGIELDDQLRFLRIRTRIHELLITPGPKYTLVVIQDPTQ